MHAFLPFVLAQAVSPEDITRELDRLHRNWWFLWLGLAVAWLVLATFLLMMVSRERRLKREIASLKAMMEERPKK